MGVREAKEGPEVGRRKALKKKKKTCVGETSLLKNIKRTPTQTWAEIYYVHGLED